MYNKVILIGNLGRDPEVRYTQSNDPIVSFSLATSESWYDKKESVNKTLTEWHRVVIINSKVANVAKQYLFKGSKVYIEGKIRTRSWMDGDQKKSIVEIILDFNGILKLLDNKGSNSTDSYQLAEDDLLPVRPGTGSSESNPQVAKDVLDFDDIPF